MRWGLRKWVGRSVMYATCYIVFVSEEFIGLFLGRVRMFPYQNSHIKAATSRCSQHQNDCIKAACQQTDNKAACIKMAVASIGTAFAIKGMCSRISHCLWEDKIGKAEFLLVSTSAFSWELDFATRRCVTKASFHISNDQCLPLKTK